MSEFKLTYFDMRGRANALQYFLNNNTTKIELFLNLLEKSMIWLKLMDQNGLK